MKENSKLTNKIIFNPREEELLRNLEEDDTLGTWIISPHATPLEKAKYNICQTITRCQIRNNLSEKEVSERLKLDKVTTGKLLRCRIDNFSPHELTIYLGRMWASGLADNKKEVGSIPPFIELAGGEKITLGEKTTKEIEKVKVMTALQKLMDEWKAIYVKDREVNASNFEKIVEGAKEIVNHLEILGRMCNPIEERTDVGILEWIKEKKPQYNSIVFRGKALQKLRGFNDELAMSRVGKEEGKGHLFVILERINEPSKVREEFLLLEKLSCLVIEFTDKNGDCDVLNLFNTLWEVAFHSSIPFTYVFVPEGEEELARRLIFDVLGGLTAEQLRKMHFLKREKVEEEHFFGFEVNKNTTSPNFLYTDPSYQETANKLV